MMRFVSSFAIFGAVGFYYVVLKQMKRAMGPVAADNPLADVFGRAERGTARAGVFGALLLIIYIIGLALREARLSKIGTLDAAVQLGGQYFYQVVFSVLLLGAFVMALRRKPAGWAVAAFIGVALTIRKPMFTLHPLDLASPLHETTASLWLGTLGVLVLAGIPAVLLSAGPREQRGPLVAELVARFSPLALWSATLMGVTGIVATWMRLHYLSALWTTPLGYALDAKLVVVLIVAALGAWNWRRLTPQLGTEGAAYELRRTASVELGFAGLVLLLTTLVVILPPPKKPSAMKATQAHSSTGMAPAEKMAENDPIP